MSGNVKASHFWDEPHSSQNCLCSKHWDEEFFLRIFPLFEDLYEHYFRTELVGAENIPVRKTNEPPLIYVANHSGMTLPWDIMMAETGLTKLYRDRGIPFCKKPRSIGADVLSDTPHMRLFFIPEVWRKLGVIDATYKNLDTMMKHSWDILLCPEGIPGIAKGFSKRYQLQSFSSAFVRMAHKYGAQIVPVSIVNAEYLAPGAFRWRFTDYIARKLFHIPFFPISIFAPFATLLPAAGYSVLPCRLTYVFSKPIEVPAQSKTRLTSREIESITREIQLVMQQNLTEAVGKYGQSPFQMKHFFRYAFKHPKKTFFSLPFFWSMRASGIWQKLMYERKGKKLSRSAQVLRALCYYVPVFGWLILYALNKRWKPTPRVIHATK